MPARPFSDLLRKVLMDNGWSHKELGDRIGVERPVITAWINEDRIPEDEGIRKVGELLEVENIEEFTKEWIVEREIRNVRKRLLRKNIDLDHYYPKAA